MVWRGREFTPWLCATCSDAHVAEVERSQREARINELLVWSNLPPLAHRWDFARAAKAGRPQVASVAAWHPGPEGLYLWGPAGTGKTVLAWCLLLREMRERLAPCLALHAPEFLAELRRGFDAGGDRRGLVDKAKTTGLLLLDDLGAERPTEWAREVLLTIVEHRITHELPIIVTSNHDLAGLHQHMGDETGRLVDRLAGACRLVPVNGESFRRQAARDRARGNGGVRA